MRQTSISIYQQCKSFSTQEKLLALRNKTTNLFSLAVAFTLFFITTTQAQTSESFDSGIPNTWTQFGSSNVGTVWLETTSGNNGTTAVYLDPQADNIGLNNSAKYFLVTPQFTVPQNGEIHFYTKQGNEDDLGSTFEIRLSTASQPDINGFNTVLKTYTESNLNLNSQTEYEKKVIKLPELPEGFKVYLAFVHNNTQTETIPTGDAWYIDDFAIVENCPTIDPETVTIDDISVDGAQVTWSHPAASNFEIQIIPKGGVPADTGIEVNGSSYMLDNIDSDTEFDIYLAAICDNTAKSEWEGPFSFKTLTYGMSCDYPLEVPDISSTPYIIEDNLANWVNENLSYSTEGSNCIQGGTSTYNYLRGDKLFLSYTPTKDALLNITQTTFNGGDASNNCFNARSSVLVYEGCENVGVTCLTGLATTKGFTPESINSFEVKAGNTYIIVVSSELASKAGICFQLELFAPDCAPPTSATYHSLTQNSVTFSWDNIGDFASSWEYTVVPSGSGEPTGSGTATTTNLNNVITTGLEAGTAYDLYIRSVCSGSPGVWSKPIPFSTLCETITPPYATGFDNTPESCWTILDANNDGITWDYLNNYATIVTRTAQNNNDDYFVSPEIYLDGSEHEIRFKHRATQGVLSYSIKVSTTGIGKQNFDTVLVPETQISNTSFQEVVYDIPENITGNVTFAWVVSPNTKETGLRLSIDDIEIKKKPTCPVPTNLFTLNVKETSAWLFWTKGKNETQWEVAIQEIGQGAPTGNGLLVSANAPYMATDLDPGTRYEFYVRAYCAEDDQSFWVGPANFTTLCTSYDAPFYESFNDIDPDTQKFCWNTSNGNWEITETAARLDAGKSTDLLISPAINLDSKKQLTYRYRTESPGTTGAVEVLLSTTNTNPSSFTTVLVPGETFTNSGYIKKSVIIENEGTVYLAFRAPASASGNAAINIDDIRIDVAPECPMPADITATNITTTSAELSWNAGYQENSWKIKLQEAGLGIPNYNDGISVTENTYSISDLSPNTAYEFYVQSNCDAIGYSEWFGPYEFRTDCITITAPFLETFDSDSTTENCWTVVDGNSDGLEWNINNRNWVYEGDQTASLSTVTNGRNNDWLISPTITLDENGPYRIRFYYRGIIEAFTEDLRVLLSTNGPEVEQFDTVLFDTADTPNGGINQTEYTVRIVNIPADVTGDINIAFHVPQMPGGGQYRGYGLLIDNINIEKSPDCPEQTNVATKNIADTSVEITWENNGSEGPWEIAVLPEGSEAPTGDVAEEYVYQAATNPFTITGLTASTKYDIYVRSACTSPLNNWSEPLEVVTKCPFDDLCQYTFVLDFGGSAAPYPDLEIYQNNQLTQTLSYQFHLDPNEKDEIPVNLCNGVEFSVFFASLSASNPSQYKNYKLEILDNNNNVVFSSPESGMEPRRTVYTGIPSCGEIACPQPTNLTASATTELSWTPAGSETQWEVAIQASGNETIPQSGIIVNTPNYTPTEADFKNSNAVTYEYFVRAVCSEDESSYWAGPYVFVRNDDASKSLTLPVNSSDTCDNMLSEITFINATVSPEPMSCEGENQRDIWFDFTAEAPVHLMEISGFEGNFYYGGGEVPFPSIVMTLYKNNGGTLEEITCTYDNVILAMHSSGLEVGQNYKLRLTLTSNYDHYRKFNLCLTTPDNLCHFNLATNGGFENPASSEYQIYRNASVLEVFPGWRQNLKTNNNLLIWMSFNADYKAFEGGQCAGIRMDDEIDPNDSNIRGLYRDFDTSEITLLDYSFRHLARFDGVNIQLFAGPAGGPYTMIAENMGTDTWELVSGQYQVPEGQDNTRIIFRAYGGITDVGNVLDDVRVYANNSIIAAPSLVECTNAIAAVSANGTGTWVADANNPGEVVFDDANSNKTNISGFTYPGEYTFTWKTRYCEYSFSMTYDGIGDTPEAPETLEYCLDEAADALTATEINGYGLIWHTTAVGGTGSTTAPTPDTSVEGSFSYYVAFVNADGCEGPRAEIVVNVNNVTPELEFSYNETCAVATQNPMPALVDEFTTGGTFASSTLTVDPETGEVDLSTATMGTHEITYTYNGDSSTCTSSGSYTASITITEAIAAVTEFAYPQSVYCVLVSGTESPLLSENFTTGGSFSSETLTVDASTGDITMDSATPGTHTVTYTFEGVEDSCYESGTYNLTLEFTESFTPVTEFTYTDNLYCANSSSAVPSLGTNFTSGGTFTAESGLNIDPVTGEINIAASSMGNYTISYTIAEDLEQCIAESTSSFNITILDSIDITVSGDCNEEEYWLTATSADGLQDSDISYLWKDANGNSIGYDAIFNVTEYAETYNVSVPFQVAVTVTIGDCESTTTFTVERTACKGVPRGISPDGNGKNDELNLKGYGVNTIYIYNRNGRLVYEFKGNYTNQWHGQSSNGNDLPDGTYFYSILKDGGESESGWIFINRTH